MSEANKVMEEALNSVLDVKVGDLVKGEVLTIQDNKQVIVGINGGIEGVVPAKELSALPVENIEELVKVGDILDLIVIMPIKDKENGSYLLSKKRVDAKKVWADIQAKYDNGELIEATVKDVVKGGLVAEAGVRAFVPASMVAEHFIEDLSGYKGQTLTFKIVEIEPSENKLILSRKAVLLAEKEKTTDAVYAALTEGDVVEGTVARLTNFGAFIDLGGVDGLVHISELAHSHVKHPSDVLNLGDVVKVKVVSMDRQAKRISLSIKETVPGPWEVVKETVSVDSVLTGVVKRLTSFGAFVELFPGVEGLVHISQISHDHIAVPHEVLKEGQEVRVQVRDINVDEQRLSLSMKSLQEKPQVVVAEVEEDTTYDVTSENTNVTLGDVLGSQLTLED